MGIGVPKKMLAVRHAASKDKARYYLNAVRLENAGEHEPMGCMQGAMAIATDGHMMLIGISEEFPKVEGGGATFALEDVERAHKTGKLDKLPGVELPHSEDSAHASDTFPNWRAVVPQNEPTLRVRLDARLLARVAKAATEFHGRKPSDQVQLEFELRGDETGPVVIKSDAADSKDLLVALVMPCRQPPRR